MISVLENIGGANHIRARESKHLFPSDLLDDKLPMDHAKDDEFSDGMDKSCLFVLNSLRVRHGPLQVSSTHKSSSTDNPQISNGRSEHWSHISVVIACDSRGYIATFPPPFNIGGLTAGWCHLDRLYSCLQISAPPVDSHVFHFCYRFSNRL